MHVAVTVTVVATPFRSLVFGLFMKDAWRDKGIGWRIGHGA